jgi:hypothetical protein
MDYAWLFLGALLVVAMVPFALYGLLLFGAWAVPAHFRWAAGIERRFYRTYWLLLGGMYLLSGILHLTRKRGEPAFGVAFLGLAMVCGSRGIRGRPAQRTANDTRG